METIKAVISELGAIRKSLSEYKNVKNGIKKKVLENLDEINRFLLIGPGVVSPELTRTRCNKVVDLIKVWYRSLQDYNSIMEKIIDIKKTFVTPLVISELNPSSEKENNIVEEVKRDNTTEESSEEPIVSQKQVTLPSYVEKLRPDNIIKGDVAFLPIGPVLHYCIVVKSVGNYSFVIPITSNLTDFVGYVIEKSRFFKGMAIFTIVQVPTSLVKRKFVMPYDNKTELSNILSECDKYLKENVLKRNYKRKKK